MTINLSKLKEISSMDVKDIGKLFKKEKSEDLNSSYEVNKSESKSKSKEKGKNVLSIDGINVLAGRLSNQWYNLLLMYKKDYGYYWINNFHNLFWLKLKMQE